MLKNTNYFAEVGPIIIQPLTALSVLEKDTFELIVTFTCEDDFKVTWYHNNQLLEENDDCKIITNREKSSIKIFNTEKKNVGKYEVVIESANGTVKSAGSVKLLKPSDESHVLPPILIRPLHPTKVHLGDIVLLETEVLSRPCASFQWFIDTREVSSYAKKNKLTNLYVSNKENVSCLCIEKVSKDFIGIITCRAENFSGSVSCSASLMLEDGEKENIGTPPTVKCSLESISVMDGEPILLHCEILGQPWPTIEWFHNGKSIERAKDVVISRQKSGLCELFIKEAFPEMTGTYKCVATNEFGTCNSESNVIVEGSEFNKILMIACDSIVHVK